jgi:hypothetical protein
MRTTGDGLLVLFVSAVDALRCAAEIQRGMAQRNAQLPRDRRIEFRMGPTSAISSRAAASTATGINVAARLKAMADAGGICLSSRVQEDAQGSLRRLGIAFKDIGQHQLKNIAQAVHVYRILLEQLRRRRDPRWRFRIGLPSRSCPFRTRAMIPSRSTLPMAWSLAIGQSHFAPCQPEGSSPSADRNTLQGMKRVCARPGFQADQRLSPRLFAACFGQAAIRGLTERAASLRSAVLI